MDLKGGLANLVTDSVQRAPSFCRTGTLSEIAGLCNQGSLWRNHRGRGLRPQ
jgi:hypothetical protein